MSTMSVHSAIMGQVDRLARWRMECQDVVSVGGGTLWTRVDAAEDVRYENIVKGTAIADVDSNIAALDAGGVISEFFVKHNDYFSDQGISGGLGGYLGRRRFRVHEEFGELYYDKYSSRLPAATVFPTVTREITEWSRAAGADVVSGIAAIPSQTLGPSVIEAYVDAVTSPGAVLSVTLPTQTGSPSKVLCLTLTSAGVGSAFALGAQALVSNVAVGAGTLGMSSTGQFVAGDVVLVKESGKTEVVTVASIIANNHLNTTSPTVNSFTTSAEVYPLFYDVVSASAVSGSTNSDKITFRPRLDRTPAW